MLQGTAICPCLILKRSPYFSPSPETEELKKDNYHFLTLSRFLMKHSCVLSFLLGNLMRWVLLLVPMLERNCPGKL
jgi:hypothetical protein